MPSAGWLGWRLSTVTLAPASRSRCATGRPSVPVPPVTRIDVVMTSPFAGRTNGARTPDTRAPPGEPGAPVYPSADGARVHQAVPELAGSPGEARPACRGRPQPGSSNSGAPRARNIGRVDPSPYHRG